MKKYISILMLFVAMGVFTVSCEQESDSNAMPVVKYVRPTDANAADSLLTRAAMGSTIALIGDGLGGVCEIWFNDQKAKLNPVYVTATSIIVNVPGTMPGKITNTITLKTSKGKQAIYDFAVIIPSPRVISIENEWALNNMTTIIRGDYFFADAEGKLVQVLFPGNVKAEVIEFDDHNIKIIVPLGALPGTVTVESIYGKGRSQFTFRDKEGLFIDAEEPTNVWNTWNRGSFDMNDGTSGQYIKLSGNTGNWAWPGELMQLVYINPTQTPLISEGLPADYALKFEYNSLNWSGAHIYFWFSPKSDVNTDDPNVAQYLWQPFLINGAYVNHVTNGWVTCTIPLSEFTHNKAGTSNIKLGKDDMINFHAFPFGEAEGVAPFEIWLDNFRIVKIK